MAPTFTDPWPWDPSMPIPFGPWPFPWTVGRPPCYVEQASDACGPNQIYNRVTNSNSDLSPDCCYALLSLNRLCFKIIFIGYNKYSEEILKDCNKISDAHISASRN